MINLIKIILIIITIVGIVIIKKKDKICQVLEKEIILKLLLFSVSLFIKNKNSKNINIKSRISKYMSEKLLFLDLWILNFRTEKKYQKLFITNEKKNTEKPN